MGRTAEVAIAFNHQVFQRPFKRDLRDLLSRLGREVHDIKLYRKSVLKEAVLNILSFQSSTCSYILCRIQCGRWQDLSRRERQVSLLVGGGHSNKAIARKLKISPATVAVYLRRTYSKLSINSRVTLAQYSVLEAAAQWSPVL